MDCEHGQIYVKRLSAFVRTHEKALANALQVRRRSPESEQPSQTSGDSSSISEKRPQTHVPQPSTSSVVAAALSLGTFKFRPQNPNSAKLTLTPHHLYFLLVQVEEMGISIGPMNIRLESLHAEASPANYVSFLSQAQRPNGLVRSEHDSIHSVSSVRSALSGISNIWSGIGFNLSSSHTARSEKTKIQYPTDLKYLYSAFTKIPCLRLSPDPKARLIRGYEEFPFDTAVPLLAFKNLSALEILDLDYRQFYGWDKLAEQLRALTLKRANLEDPSELFVGIVLDDMDKRRRRSSKAQSSPGFALPSSPWRVNSTPSSPGVEGKLGQSSSPSTSLAFQRNNEVLAASPRPRTKSESPSRPSHSNSIGRSRCSRNHPLGVKRSDSESSCSTSYSSVPGRSGSSSNLLSIGTLPPRKWSFLRHLNLSDNGLAFTGDSSFEPVANTLHSLDLSFNLFSEIPDSLSNLKALRALNLSNCLIESLRSLNKGNPLQISALNLRANRLTSIAGIERLLSIERLDLRDNLLQDPTEMARLTGTTSVREVWVLRNPFVKTHCNYRVVIFNIFRSTMGYRQDILIDASGPSRGERKRLKDYLTEAKIQPGLESTIEDAEGSGQVNRVSLTTVPKPPPIDILRRHEPQRIRSDVGVDEDRRKPIARRRIIDLAHEESSVSFYHFPEGSPEDPRPPNTTEQTTAFSNAQKLHPPHIERRAASSHSETPDQTTSQSNNLNTEVSSRERLLATENQGLNISGHAYRQKIEALKDEVGSNWLTFLGSNIRGSEDLSLDLFSRPTAGSKAPMTRGQGVAAGDGTMI